ncbi:unnamed protein product [Trichogramma brassicae]|uniref:Uncharacterized protein n=1 Tax=Trichogramma brassicae TaxID=86971 RepID=A0A6H5J9R2_9HYME|nr:unnamed protein product [Trichogramma brassicae]
MPLLLRSSCCLASNEAQSDGRSRRYGIASAQVHGWPSCKRYIGKQAASHTNTCQLSRGFVQPFETQVSSALTFAHRRRSELGREIYISEHILHGLSSSSSKLKQGEQLPGRERE